MKSHSKLLQKALQRELLKPKVKYVCSCHYSFIPPSIHPIPSLTNIYLFLHHYASLCTFIHLFNICLSIHPLLPFTYSSIHFAFYTIHSFMISFVLCVPPSICSFPYPFTSLISYSFVHIFINSFFRFIHQFFIHVSVQSPIHLPFVIVLPFGINFIHFTILFRELSVLRTVLPIHSILSPKTSCFITISSNGLFIVLQDLTLAAWRSHCQTPPLHSLLCLNQKVKTFCVSFEHRNVDFGPSSSYCTYNK